MVGQDGGSGTSDPAIPRSRDAARRQPAAVAQELPGPRADPLDRQLHQGIGVGVYGVQSYGSYWYPGGLDPDLIPQ